MFFSILKVLNKDIYLRSQKYFKSCYGRVKQFKIEKYFYRNVLDFSQNLSIKRHIQYVTNLKLEI